MNDEIWSTIWIEAYILLITYIIWKNLKIDYFIVSGTSPAESLAAAKVKY